MSIKCKSCTYEMSTFEFLGCLTAELFEVLKGRLTRGVSDNWDQFMAGFSNDKKIACPICEKHVGWIAEATYEAFIQKIKNQGIQNEV
ncbi:hypothetical protein K2W90_02660 [Candidatus Babeliales bacterium]|nr:hypothetical protein [Candidatus Babeliales bacterium]